MPRTTLPAALLALVVLVHKARSHGSFVEPERGRQGNFGGKSWAAHAPDGVFGPNGPVRMPEDFSLANPFDIVEATKDSKGNERPSSAIFVSSRLHRCTDVDYYLYRKTTDVDQIMVGYPIVPACRVYKNFFPTIALTGPTGVIDKLTGKPLFEDPTGDEPFEIPRGYGVRIVRHAPLPSTSSRRPIFIEESFSQNQFFLPFGYDQECIEDALNPACDNTNIILASVNTPADYYWVVYYEDFLPQHVAARLASRRTVDGPTSDCKGVWDRDGVKWRRPDFSLVTGPVDAFELVRECDVAGCLFELFMTGESGAYEGPGALLCGPDFRRFLAQAPLVVGGASLRNTCRAPYRD